MTGIEQPTVLEAAFAVAEVDLRDRYGPETGVPWWMAPIGLTDHLYPTCPGLRRSLRPGVVAVQGRGLLYPEAGDVCGWCVRVWRARRGAAGSGPEAGR